MQLRDATVVLTGAASGIGLELARELLARGARVAAVDLRADDLDALVASAAAGPSLSTHVVDVSDRSAVEALPAEVIEQHGRVDVLINNAGIIQPFVPLRDLDYAVIERVMAVNFMGPVHMIQAFLPHLEARPAAHICNVSSMGGFAPFPGQTIYGASKAALKLMSEGLYAELLDGSVGVSVALPGGIDTKIAENSGVEAPKLAGGRSGYRMTAPREAAEAICDGIEGGELHILIGRDAKLMYAATRLAPKASTRLLQRQMKGLIEP